MRARSRSRAPAACGGVVFFTRARLRRVAGALAGGMVFGATWVFKLRLDYSMGWWRTRFAETPDPFSLFSPTLGFLGIAVGGALCFWFPGAWPAVSVGRVWLSLSSPCRRILPSGTECIGTYTCT